MAGRGLPLERAGALHALLTHPPGRPPTPQFMVYGIPANPAALEALDADISAELAALAEEGPTQAELARYKKVWPCSIAGGGGGGVPPGLLRATHQP